MIDELTNKCGCRLIETHLLSEAFEQYRYFFDNVAQYEAVEKTKNYFMKTKEFYNFDNEINKSSFELTKLNRFFVFQKLK